ncbi:L-aminoadipate-semialdehyde dehydrogenase-phosphopantetheinyl transferase isoform X2 [Ambystoma mexicanum]|uniref:L-aminoadipate-semialdehyde dehydrogenase-phosphopantetheinyl transferase isoform X2 n=1 Tax=Ambystoma mexicanum TaxID=8296 RepID=UPI0037E92B27
MGSARWAFSCGTWTPGRAQWLLAARCVQPEEKLRIGQFIFTRDAKAAMAGRLMIRKVIAEKLKIQWDEIVLKRTAKGKPFLLNDYRSSFPAFNFNVSHQGNYAVLAAESGLQVGIDVMKTDFPGSGSIEEFFRIMNRQFTDTEWKSIKSMESEWTQLDTFYRHWETRLDDLHHVAVAIGRPDGFGDHHCNLMHEGDADRIKKQFTLLSFDDLVASAVPMYPEDPPYWESFISKQETPSRQGAHST